MDKETKEFIKSEIADLAQMITRSFDGLNHQIDARFAKVDERFEQVERDLGEVKETVERIDRRTQNQVDPSRTCFATAAKPWACQVL